jgi:hypothetical protein
MKKLSLSPYVGKLLITDSVKEYQRQHVRMFGHLDDLGSSAGRFRGLLSDDGSYTYLVWSKKGRHEVLAHEIAHVVLSVFELCGIDPREANGEPFCYMLSQLILDSA